jgi:hypothetical protein
MPTVTRKIFKCVHANGAFIADYRYVPIITIKWTGTLENALLDHLWELRDEHAFEGNGPWHHVYIQDMTDAAPLTATVRKYMADKQAQDPLISSEQLKMLVLPVVPNPLLRGVATAVVWMTGKEKLQMEFVMSIEKGIEAAKIALDRWGLPFPKGLDAKSYATPTDSEVNLVFRKS